MRVHALLHFLLLALRIGVLAKGRGGGGVDGGGVDGGGGDDEDDDDNGGNNGDDGKDGDDGTKDDPQAKINATCRTDALLTSPLWLHRWVGSYYNGTIVRKPSPSKLMPKFSTY